MCRDKNLKILEEEIINCVLSILYVCACEKLNEQKMLDA